MENGIFARLSIEEHTEVASSQFALEKDVLSEEAYTEAMAIASDIEADVAAMTQAEKAVERLEAQIATEEKMLEAPESVSSSTVILAQESLATTAALLGAPTAFTVSQEAAVANPVSALTVSNEAVKDFLKKVIESIKAIFRKIMNSAKKLFVKLVVAMDGTAKKAKALAKVADKLSGEPTQSKFSEKETRSLFLKLAAVLLIQGKEKLNFEDVDIDSEKSVMELVKLAEEAAKNVEETAGKKDEKEAKKSSDKINEALEDLKSNPVEKSMLEKYFGYNEPTDAKDLKLYAVAAKGATLKILESYTEDKEDGEKVIKVRTLKVDKTVIPEYEVEVASIAKIKEILATTIISAKNTKKISNEAMKGIQTVDKALDKMAKEEPGSYIINKIKAGAATKARDIVVGAMLDSVLAYVSTTKASLAIASANIDKYKNSSEM